MKKLLLLFIAINCYAQTPNIEWQKSLGGANNDNGSTIKQANDGGYISVGTTLSNDIFPSANHHGDYDVYVVKTDNIGNIEWQKTIGGANYDVGISVSQTIDNGYIIAGYTSSNDGDITSNHGLFDALVIKLDALGNIVWQKTYGGSQIENAFDLIQTDEGGYIVAGTSQSNDGQVSQNQGSVDVWIFKIDASGTIEWEKTFGGSTVDFITSIIKTSDNGFAIVGHTFSNDGDILQNQGNADAWIVKISNTGTIVWQKTYGGSEGDYLYSIQQTNDGGYITCGQTESSDGNLSSNHGITDAWIMKLNPLGEIEWNKTYGGSNDDGLNSIIQTTDGQYIFGGNTYSSDFDINTNFGESDCWIMKLNNNGDLVWEKNYGGSDNEAINNIIKTSDNSFIYVGYSYSNDGNVTINNGLIDMWLVKLTAEQLSNSGFSQGSLEVFPNPTTNLLNLQIPGELAIDAIIVSDLTGKKVLEQTPIQHQINTQNLVSGIYFLKVIVGDQTYKTKFIKN
jgi:hypothetical protein